MWWFDLAPPKAFAFAIAESEVTLPLELIVWSE